jgi:hypothetical protein
LLDEGTVADPGATSLPFEDRDEIAPWAQHAVAAAMQSGLIQGKPDNRFAPLDKTSRAEAAVLLFRMLE